ncbi:MAG: hypothetical protein ACI8TP_001924 [Acidimicrobiales bacterium]|jgi:hypothetical protein
MLDLKELGAGGNRLDESTDDISPKRPFPEISKPLIGEVASGLRRYSRPGRRHARLGPQRSVD